MKCSKCGTVLKGGEKFCRGCGSKLSYDAPVPVAAPAANKCASCGAALRPGAAFCNVCGTPVASTAAPAPTPAPTPVAKTAPATITSTMRETKHLTAEELADKKKGDAFFMKASDSEL